MIRQHPNPQMSIPISLAIWHQLLGGTSSSGYQKEDWEIAAEAIEEWTRRHNPDALSMPCASGYQWKSQFLPDGTLLRTVFGGKNHHGQVEGDRILYKGKAVSPSGFVNAVGGIRRNAWRCIWILFPDSKDWTLADTLRGGGRPRRARKQVPDTRQAPAQPTLRRGPDNAPQAASPTAAQSGKAAPSASESPHVCEAMRDRRPPGDARKERRTGQQLLPLLYQRSSDYSISPNNLPMSSSFTLG